MNIAKETLLNADHCTLVVDDTTLPLGSALYTWLLMHHKKVSLVATKKPSRKYGALPWIDKVRYEVKKSSDLVHELRCNVQELHQFFIQNNAKINAKIATALCYGYIIEYNFFTSNKTDGIIFASIAQLIDQGADFHLCKRDLVMSRSLASVRLQGYLFQTMMQKNNGTQICLYVTDELLELSGATLDDCDAIMEECLKIVHVQEVVLYKNDTIITILKD